MTVQIASEKNKLRPFNPNDLSDQEWIELGLSAGHVRSIRKFQSRGGIFKTREDLGKMYVIPDNLFKKWYSYIQLPCEGESATKFSCDPSQENRKVFRGNKVPEYFVIEINSADSSTLKKLPGIGSFFANQILKFRDALGGFVSAEQLNEVYHLGAERVKLIQAHLQVNSESVRKINLNTADAPTLNAHPYLSQNQATSIVYYRQKHGLFQDLESLRYVASIDTATYRKILPYLSLGDN